MMGLKYRRNRPGRLAPTLVGLFVTAVVVALPAAAGGSDAAARHATSSFWTAADESDATPADGKAYVRPERFSAFTLDRGDLSGALEDTPREFARGGEPLVFSLPAPRGGFERFTLEEAPIMEAALARKHPDITTYRGRGIDDPAATIRADLTPLGFHASVRSPRGSWYIDPYFHLDDRLYISYFARDLEDDPHGTFIERKDETWDDESLETVLEEVAEAGPVTGPELRTYRLALVTDPTYANFFGGPANVTPAKVTLINRVTQIYEDETSIRLVLVGNNDLLNLDTEAKMTRGNGPCGEAPCYTPSQATSCASATLNRTRIVIGQIVGASNFDVGHIGLGNPGGGVASLGVIGGNSKAQGCTGLAAPVGDYFAVDYVAHELGHQFNGSHTFNGNQVNCAGGNRSAANSVEPGSGSSIMAYAGICRQDNIQPHSDPYWSQRSFEQITGLVQGDRPPIDEVQTASLDDYSGGANEVQTIALSSYGGTDSFQLQFNGSNSVSIVRGSNYTAAGIKAAIESIPGFPAGGTVTVTAIGNPAGAPTDAGFDVVFGGTLANTDVGPLTVVNGVGATGTTTENFNGGPVNDSFTINYNGANTVPFVHGVNYTLAAIQTALQGASEVQTVSLAGYDANGDSFTLSYNGGTTVPIIRGQNNTAAGIQNAIQGGNEQQQVTLGSFNGATQSFQIQVNGQNSAVLGAGGLAISNANVAAAVNAIPGFAGTVASSGAGNTGFTLTFGGASANTDVPTVSIVNCTAPCTSSVRETAKGGGPMAGWPVGGTVVVSGLSDTGFTLTFSGALQGTDVAPFSVTNGTGGTTGSVVETVKGTAGILPVGATATVAGWAGAATLNDSGFQVTFGGNLGLVDVNLLGLTNLNGLTGFFGETAQGGPVENKGFTVTPTGNSAPVVTTPAGYTIPTRTPFSLTGSATDPDGDTLTYMWEQNDRGGATGTALVNPNKVDGPLFRQFGRPLDESVYNPTVYNSPGENHPTAADRTRIFPDMAQILADNTNAKTGDCVGPPIPPSPPSGPTNVPQPQIECYSEFLPTAAWVGVTGDRTMHFRLTARDGEGGVASATTDTAVTIAPSAGPFLVTSQAAPQTGHGAGSLPVTWDVAGTDAAPVSAAEVRITLSTDGGLTFPHVLAAATPNDGSHSVTLPNVATTSGRIRIEAVGNVFFDISDAPLTIQAVAEISGAESRSLEYSDPFMPEQRITATDPDSPGSSLSATATGLPAGLSLEVVSTSSGATGPGTRTWRVAGVATGAPGAYEVTIRVTDDQGHTTTQVITITVVAADARVTYTGETLKYTRGASGTVTLSASVVDGAVGSQTPDASPGDIRKATVTFLENGRALCGPLPVEATNGDNTAGTASCRASLAAGQHRIQIVVGDHYAATESARVRVQRAVGCSVSARPSLLFAGRQSRVRAVVSLSGSRYADARVRFRGPGFDRTVGVDRTGVALVGVRPSRPGILQVSVRADQATLGCRATARIMQGSGTAGVGLTGRPL